MGWRIKKPPFFLGGFLFESLSSLGAFGFGEPPVVIQCRGYKGHDDGNKRNKGDVEVHGKDGPKLGTAPSAVNLTFSISPRNIGRTSRG